MRGPVGCYDQRLQAVLGACGSLDLLPAVEGAFEFCGCVLFQHRLTETTANEYKYDTQWRAHAAKPAYNGASMQVGLVKLRLHVGKRDSEVRLLSQQRAGKL